jgi:flagellar biosynthesis protein FlhA
VVDNSTVVATHLTEVIRENAPDLLGRQETQQLLDNLSKTSPKAVEELVPGYLSIGIVQKVLQNLLRERISVRDLLTIVETLADYAPMSKDPDLLTEYVRQKLARGFISSFVNTDGTLSVIVLDSQVEDQLSKTIQHTEQGSYLTAGPALIESVMASAKKQIENVMRDNMQPILLCSPVLRRHLRRLVEATAPSVMVLSHAEIIPNIRIQSIGKVTINNGS